jgi:UDP-N-acetylglucosamine diphosphorylase/glucosamine-1-phosphate N-acetyltransferase
MLICLFEDPRVAFLSPLTVSRPAFDLWCGASTLLDRHRRFFNATQTAAQVRPQLADWCRLHHADLTVNEPVPHGGSTVYVNARWLPPAMPPREIETPYIATVDDQVAYVVAPGVTNGTLELAEQLETWKQTLPRVAAGGRMINYPWDLVELNAEALEQDYHRLTSSAGQAPTLDGPAVQGPRERLVVAEGAQIEPLVAVDTRKGPVLIDKDAVVQSFSRLEGPCYIGLGTQILGANIRGSSFGPQCKVGGEVEASIFQGFSNKAHDGFVGHSVIGAWVNLAAGTQLSDLRNDYGVVRVTLAGEKIHTGLTKVGSFIGDHTKTGLNTLLNTGTVVGAFCHLLPWNTLLPRVIPSFCTYWHGQLQERADLRQLFTTAATVLRRRGCEWTDTHLDFFLDQFDATAAERHAVLRESEKRRLRRIV